MSNNKYKQEYCIYLIEHMGKRGQSYDSFPAYLYNNCKVMIGLSTLYNWENLYPEWKEAKEIAVSASMDYHEKRVRVRSGEEGEDLAGINPKNISDNLVGLVLKTRFHKTYGEKKEVSVNIKGHEQVLDFLDDEDKS